MLATHQTIIYQHTHGIKFEMYLSEFVASNPNKMTGLIGVELMLCSGIICILFRTLLLSFVAGVQSCKGSLRRSLRVCKALTLLLSRTK